MELESSSPYPQVPATCPYPEPTPTIVLRLTKKNPLLSDEQKFVIDEVLEALSSILSDTGLLATLLRLSQATPKIVHP
jgi:hypothetical protein